MKRIIFILIGASFGVAVVIGGMYIILDHTSLVANLGPGAAIDSPVVDTSPQVVMAVNGVAITGDMIEAEIKVSRLNLVDPMPPLSGEDLARAREEALNQLVTRQLILQAAARQNFKLDEAFVEQRVDLLFGGSGDEVLDEALRKVGLSREDVEWWVREIFTVEEFTTQVVMANALPAERQQVYNAWLNQQRAAATVQNYTAGEAPSLGPLIGEAAPDFSLMTPDNRQISLADYRGQVVLVNFWATWCPSCVVELPAYQQVYQTHGQGQGDFVVLGVNLQERADHVQEYAAGLGLTFPILLDQDGAVATRRYQATGLPASFIIDRDGNIFYRHLGPMRGETLEEKLVALGL